MCALIPHPPLFAGKVRIMTMRENRLSALCALGARDYLTGRTLSCPIYITDPHESASYYLGYAMAELRFPTQEGEGNVT